MFHLTAPEPLTFCILLVENFSMMSLSSAIEPLRSANRLIDREVFRWRICTLDGQPMAASNGIALPAQSIETALDGAHALFVCGGMRVELKRERPYLSALRMAARRGLAIGSLSTGSQLLARAGLLDGYRCTIHWENSAAFADEFPDVIATGKLYEIDRNRMTCSGGTAAMDMMLRIIADRHGGELARSVANQFHHERIRGSGEEQQGGRLQQLETFPAAMQKALLLMRQSLENPRTMEAIAQEIGVGARQLERLFRQHAGSTPARHYLSLRIDRARELLIYTNLPVIEIAMAVGFASTSHLSTWCRKLYGQRPSEIRQRSAANVSGEKA